MLAFECRYCSLCMLLCNWRQHLVHCWQITSEQTGTNQNNLRFFLADLSVILKTAIFFLYLFWIQMTSCSSANHVFIWYSADKKKPRRRNLTTHNNRCFWTSCFVAFSSSALFCILCFRSGHSIVAYLYAFDISPLNTHKQTRACKQSLFVTDIPQLRLKTAH